MFYSIEDYKVLEDEMRDLLESNYQCFMINGEQLKAYHTLGDLMAYKLIDRSDPRIEVDNKSLRKLGVDKGHRFSMDYRSGTNYIPAWLFGKLERYQTFSLMSIEHWGIRLENGYEGYTIFKPHSIKIKASLCRTSNMASDAVTDICNIYKKALGKNLKDEPLRSMCIHGVSRIYTFDIDGAYINHSKTIGYALVMMDESGPVIKLIPKYSAIVDNWLPINECLAGMKEAIVRCITSNGMWTKVKKVITVIPNDQAFKDQKIKLDYVKGIVDELNARAAAEREKAEAEKLGVEAVNKVETSVTPKMTLEVSNK